MIQQASLSDVIRYAPPHVYRVEPALCWGGFGGLGARGLAWGAPTEPLGPFPVSGYTVGLFGGTENLVKVGDKVGEWTDDSGNANSPVQGTDAVRPGTVTVNGIEVPLFTGSAGASERLVKDTWSAGSTAQPVTYYVVCTRTDTTSQGLSVGLSGTGLIHMNGGDMTITVAGIGNRCTLTGFASTGVPMLCRLILNGASSSLYAEKTGAAPASNTGDVGSGSLNAPLSVGSRTTPAVDNFWRGAVCDGVIFPGLLSSGDDDDIMAWFRARWGIAPTS
jgi:hypothetical protein